MWPRFRIAVACQRAIQAVSGTTLPLRQLASLQGRMPSSHPSSSPVASSAHFQRMFGNMQQSRTFFTASDTQLARLERESEANKSDAQKQLAYFRAIIDDDPHEIIRRMESGRYAANEACVKLYMKALVDTNKIGTVSNGYLAALLQASSQQSQQQSPPAQQMSQGVSKSGFTSMGVGAKTENRSDQYYSQNFSHPPPSSDGKIKGGTKEEPLHVVIGEPPGSAFWKFVRNLVFFAIVYYAMMEMLDKSPAGKAGAGQMNEIKPEVQPQKTTFADVQGVDEAKHELQHIVEFLRNPKEFTKLGGKLPKGLLLTGPPGTGKTMLARAVAGEAGVPFYYCSGSDFDEMFVGVGSRRVRELFAAARRKAPCIIFMDEIDAVGARRTTKDQQYAKMTLNQLLVELDGFKSGEGIIVIAATNLPELLDPALTRPGRFDTHIAVSLPDLRGREKILRAHSKSLIIENGEDLMKIARGTPGFSGADLSNLLNQAAIHATHLKRKAVTLADMEFAKDKILMGAERKSAVMSDKERKLTAYHEGGHAICALYVEGAMPLYKATIVPRGSALGMVTQLPEDDVVSMTRQEMKARLVVAMGGRAAEERYFGSKNVTSGASSDVDGATRLARAMVMKFAMSEKVGPVHIDDDTPVSGETRVLIESEVRALLQGALDEAHTILKEHDTEHRRIAEALLDYETLTADEMRLAIAGKLKHYMTSKQ